MQGTPSKETQVPRHSRLAEASTLRITLSYFLKYLGRYVLEYPFAEQTLNFDYLRPSPPEYYKVVTVFVVHRTPKLQTFSTRQMFQHGP